MNHRGILQKETDFFEVLLNFFTVRLQLSLKILSLSIFDCVYMNILISTIVFFPKLDLNKIIFTCM